MKTPRLYKLFAVLIILNFIIFLAPRHIFAYTLPWWVGSLGAITLSKVKEMYGRPSGVKIAKVRDVDLKPGSIFYHLGVKTQVTIVNSDKKGFMGISCRIIYWWLLYFNEKGVLVGGENNLDCLGDRVTKQQLIEAHPGIKFVRSPWNYRLYGYAELDTRRWLQASFDEDDVRVSSIVYGYGGWTKVLELIERRFMKREGTPR